MREDPVVNAPIRSLQLMLRTIAFATGEIPAVIPDGIFGASTEDAVSVFQKVYSLPVTGVADEETFRAIVSAYNLANEALSPVQSAVFLFPTGLVISGGQHHPHVRLAQAMLLALRQEFPALTSTAVSGILDPVTAENLRLLQELSGLEVTGQLDKRSWNLLSRLYRGLFDRSLPPSQG